jgi:hypothetical protein
MSTDFQLDRQHCIHFAWEDGLLKSTGPKDAEFSTPKDVDDIFKKIEKSDKKHIAIYVHGGLVSSSQEGNSSPFHLRPENEILFNALSPHTYPVYFIWETGVRETIQSLGTDFAKEVAQNPMDVLTKKMAEVTSTVLFKKLMQYLPKALAKKAKISGMGLSERSEIREVPIEDNLEFLAEYEPDETDYEEITDADKEEFYQRLSDDTEFMEYLGEIASSQEPGMGMMPTSRYPDYELLENTEWMYALQEDAQANIYDEELPRLVEEPGMGLNLSRGPIFKNVAFQIGELLARVAIRFVMKTSHGFVPTIVEEFCRMTYVKEISTIIWRQMKENARQAYDEPGPQGHHGGRYFIEKLAGYLLAHPDTRITLIGHSAGTIHLSHFIACADACFSEKKPERICI